MPRTATSVNPATNTPATTAVMVTVAVAVAVAGAGAGRGSTGGLEVSQIVSAARDVGVQDVPLLPEPASWKGVRGGGGGWAGLETRLRAGAPRESWYGPGTLQQRGHVLAQHLPKSTG
jgi:hypothetical protein